MSELSLLFFRNVRINSTIIPECYCKSYDFIGMSVNQRDYDRMSIFTFRQNNAALRDAPLRCAPSYYIVCEMSIYNFLRNVNIDILYHNLYFSPTFRFLGKYLIFGQNFGLWLNNLFFAPIYIFDQHFDF